MHFGRNLKSLFLFLVAGIFLFSATPELLGWSGSTGGDDSPEISTTDKGAQVPGKIQRERPTQAIEPGTDFKPPPPGATIKPGGVGTPQVRDLPRGQIDIGGVIPPDYDDDDDT